MPSINNYNFQQIHDRRLSESICVAAIVQVTAFDSLKMTVDVQPLSKHLQNGNYESQPPILSIPVACTRSGGFIFRPWIKVGDVGIVVYLDHDLDSAVAGGIESNPLTERNHATTDAVFVGGIVAGNYCADNLPAESLILAAENGSIYIAVTKDNVQIKGDVHIIGNLSVAENTRFDGNGTIRGNITANGEIAVKGNISAQGGITAQGDILAENKVSVAHHIHPGDSGGRTGQPT